MARSPRSGRGEDQEGSGEQEIHSALERSGRAGQPRWVQTQYGDAFDVVDLDGRTEHVGETRKHGNLQRQRAAIAQHPFELALLDIAGREHDAGHVMPIGDLLELFEGAERRHTSILRCRRSFGRRKGTDDFEPVLRVSGELADERLAYVAGAHQQRVLHADHPSRIRTNRETSHRHQDDDVHAEQQDLGEVESAHRRVARVDPKDQPADDGRVEEPRKVVHRRVADPLDVAVVETVELEQHHHQRDGEDAPQNPVSGRRRFVDHERNREGEHHGSGVTHRQ